MLSLYTTLSLRYLARRWFRAVLIVASIALGVGTLVATQALNATMTRTGLNTINPLAGAADLLVNNGDLPVRRELAEELARVPGVAAVHPRIFENLQMPEHDDRAILLVGIDYQTEMEDKGNAMVRDATGLSYDVLAYGMARLQKQTPVLVGKELEKELGDKQSFTVRSRPGAAPVTLHRFGAIESKGMAAALSGHVVIVLDLAEAAKLAGLKEGQVSRLDLTLDPGADAEKVKADITRLLAQRAEVHTPQERDEMVQSVMAGMQTGFSLCGLAALVVGLFLVYNALSVSVAERRHEIGILLSVGATRQQVRRLFAGEAAVLGLAGSVLGIPLGMALAYIGLGPIRAVLRDILLTVEAHEVELSLGLVLVALATGVVTAVAASLVPAIIASSENPAEAVRRVPPVPTWRFRALQMGISLLLMIMGLNCILLRGQLPHRWGGYGGLVLFLLGSLLATPLLAAVAARLLQPLLRAFTGIEGRLAGDNMVRAPARTGLVVAALAAGVALVMQTAGTIRSNRGAVHDWVEDFIRADLIVTSGSPFGAGSMGRAMDLDLGRQFASLPGVEAVLPLRSRKHAYADTQVLLSAIEAGPFVQVNAARHMTGLDVFRILASQPDTAIVSENFSALYGVGIGDVLTLPSPRGPVRLRVVGKIVDYSWNHGSITIDRHEYLRYWDDDKVDIFDVYLRPEAAQTKHAVQESMRLQFGAQHGLIVQTHEELQDYIDTTLQRLYGIAFGQQIVVMIVASLGVVTALLISVLQRRREMGLLRAIGASQAQVVRSVLAEAALMGVIGTAIGLLVGVPLEWYVLQVLILEESGYLFAVRIPWGEALAIAAGALTLAALAGLGPALYAVRQRIPEAIAYE